VEDRRTTKCEDEARRKERKKHKKRGKKVDGVKNI